MVVLIVEDDTLVAIHLAQELTAAGHTVVGPTAHSGTAIELALGHRPALALVDITPERPRDGVLLARTLQQLGIPSVFLSAQHNVARANSDAALGLIAKPYALQSIRESLQIVEAMLAGHAPPKDTGALELFPTSRRSPSVNAPT